MPGDLLITLGEKRNLELRWRAWLKDYPEQRKGKGLVWFVTFPNFTIFYVRDHRISVFCTEWRPREKMVEKYSNQGVGRGILLSKCFLAGQKQGE